MQDNYLDVYELEMMLDGINDAEVAEYNEEDDYGKAFEFIQKIIDQLPDVWDINNPVDDWTKIDLATNGNELLFKYEADCWRIADLLDKKVFCYPESDTGYYDPDEDERYDCVDPNTGWYYIDWD